jgi:hypothetical protein
MKRLLLGMLFLCGSARADLVVSPEELDFQVQAILSVSEPRTTTVTNTGNEAVTIVAIATVLPPINVFRRTGGSCGAAPFTLAPQATCTILYTFSPSSTRIYYERIRITLAGGGSVEFALRGEGDTGRLEMTPTTLDFGPTPVGTVGLQMSVLIENVRRVPLQIRSFVPTNVPAASAFVITAGSCAVPPFLFPANSSCTLSYTFVPTREGQLTTDIEIRTEGFGGGFFSYTLTGTGTPELALFEDGFEEPAPAPFE